MDETRIGFLRSKTRYTIKLKEPKEIQGKEQTKNKGEGKGHEVHRTAGRSTTTSRRTSTAPQGTSGVRGTHGPTVTAAGGLSPIEVPTADGVSTTATHKVGVNSPRTPRQSVRGTGYIEAKPHGGRGNLPGPRGGRYEVHDNRGELGGTGTVNEVGSQVQGGALPKIGPRPMRQPGGEHTVDEVGTKYGA
ncbi:unnamed protein product [Calypogeia fissa]